MLNHRFSSYVTSYDVSSNIYQALSGGAYLCGTEQIEWSDALGTMQMFTVNESHSHLITAEEICVIRADPSRPDAGTIKTLTVRARLRLRGWWTFGISHVAERFLLGRYTALVEQGRRIELEEIARWRATGKAQELLVGKLTAAPEAAAKEDEDEDEDGLDSAEEDADGSDSSCASNDGFHSVNGSFYAFSMKSGMVSGYQSANELDPEAGLIHNARHDSHHMFTSRLFR